MRITVIASALLALAAQSLLALEIHFKPSFVELVSEGVSQRVRAGELVEVPVGDSMMEMEVSDGSPRKVELRARGRCEFDVFGSPATLEDGGTMTMGMDPETRKLDIAWVKGEMKSPPASFDKAATAAFFAGGSDDYMRPMEFPGVRPFGYTDALEGRGSMVAEGDYRSMPPLPDAPYMPHRQPPGYMGPGSMPSDEQERWQTFEEEYSSLPPLSLPPPTRASRSSAKKQLLVLSPADPPEPAPGGEEKTDPENQPPEKSPAREKEYSGEPPSPSPSAEPAPESQADQPSSDSGKKDSGPKGDLDATPPEGGEATPPRPKVKPPKADRTALAVTPAGNGRGTEKPAAPATRTQVQPSSAKNPTLYDRVVAQEEKQREMIELLREMSKQVQDLKQPAPASENYSQGQGPSPAPASAPEAAPAAGQGETPAVASAKAGEGESPAPPKGNLSPSGAPSSPVLVSAPKGKLPSASVPPSGSSSLSSTVLPQSLDAFSVSAASTPRDPRGSSNSTIQPSQKRSSDRSQTKVPPAAPSPEWDFSLEASAGGG